MTRSRPWLREDVERSSPRNLVLFFLLAFGWSWGLWGPKALVAQGVIEGWPRLPEVAAFGPTVAGIVMLYLEGGRAGLRRLLARTLDTDFPLRWLLVALLLFPILTGLVLGIAMTQGTSPSFPWEDDLIVLPAAFVFILLLGGPLQEEFGWRGYALDPLQSRFGATRGSLVLGVLWALWHLPLFYIPTQTIYYERPFWGLLLSVTMLAVVMTWVYNNVGGSLLVMVLLHTAFNWSQGMLPVLETELGGLLFIGAMAVLTVAVVVVWGPRDLVRERGGRRLRGRRTD
ncbi:MAG TPA: type II CAAX endopeptidase family protein [Natrialbaceae archaeon]|nr:type II CAAX endopeptidase family protein [Natrialbaceae archaeon]